MEQINEFLIKDKFANLEQVAEILQEEFTPIARNFFLLKDDLVVRYHRVGDSYVFNVEIPVSRIKTFGNKLY